MPPLETAYPPPFFFETAYPILYVFCCRFVVLARLMLNPEHIAYQGGGYRVTPGKTGREGKNENGKSDFDNVR